MNIDTDGDPQSYGPLNTPNIRPLDDLGNAGYVDPDKDGADFKHRGNKQRREAYEKGIASARTEYEDLRKQRIALDPKAVEQKRKDLEQKIVDADKALNDLKQQKADLDPEKVAKARDDLAKNDHDDHWIGKIPDAYQKIYDLNPYEFKPLPDRWKNEPWRQELWQPEDKDETKPPNLGKIFWHWYGVASLTPQQAKIEHPVKGTNKTPIL
jgi:hypothetical protein